MGAQAALAKLNQQVVCLSTQKKSMSATLPKKEEAPFDGVG